jgi:hypothetical protein
MVRKLAHGIGTGLIAGLVGTAAMTVSSTIEMKVRGRQASSAPADAAEKVLGIEKFKSDADERRFATLVHWGYGTGWGAVRGLLRAAGVAAGGGHGRPLRRRVGQRAGDAARPGRRPAGDHVGR